MMAPADRYGKCALTGNHGKLVKSHLLPRALMEFGPSNVPIVLLRGDAARPIKRWTSWYDSRLVTRAGEDILARQDNWAVDFLRHHRLVWSSWGDEGSPPLDDDYGPFGIRAINEVPVERLRMFVISLLWRAAASNLPEFASIQIPAEHLENLRVALVTGVLPNESFYPSTFTQFSTKGQDHIWAPEALIMPWFDDRGTQIGQIPIFRLFLNGLNILIRRSADYAEWTGKGLGVNDNGQLIIQTFKFENSRQH